VTIRGKTTFWKGRKSCVKDQERDLVDWGIRTNSIEPFSVGGKATSVWGEGWLGQGVGGVVNPEED